MEFKETQAIYRQIADYVCDNILEEHWPEEDRIPSIRELAVSTEVNPNTVMRTYTYLQNQGIIYNERGIGYFVASDASAKIAAIKREEFMTNDLPELFKKMDLLGIGVEEIERRYGIYKGGNGQNENQQ